MIHSALALQKAIHDTLTDSPNLTALLGGPNIHDGVPRGKNPPYVSFGDSVHRGIPDSGGEIVEHAITLSIWARKGGRKTLFEIVQSVADTLALLPGESDGHAIANFSLEQTDVSKTREAQFLRAKMHYRAVTEPLSGN